MQRILNSHKIQDTDLSQEYNHITNYSGTNSLIYGSPIWVTNFWKWPGFDGGPCAYVWMEGLYFAVVLFLERCSRRSLLRTQSNFTYVRKWARSENGSPKFGGIFPLKHGPPNLLFPVDLRGHHDVRGIPLERNKLLRNSSIIFIRKGSSPSSQNLVNFGSQSPKNLKRLRSHMEQCEFLHVLHIHGGYRTDLNQTSLHVRQWTVSRRRSKKLGVFSS